MSRRIALVGFGRSVEMVFSDSKEIRKEKVVRRSYKLKNRLAPHLLALEDEEITTLDFPRDIHELP